jgi:hypothetical protein
MGLSKVKKAIAIIGTCILIIVLIALFFNIFINNKVNVVGWVLCANGTPAGDAKVTLWHDGKIVRVPDNPQYCQITNRYNRTDSWYEFDNVPAGDYYITAEKDGYVGWDFYDQSNAMAMPLGLYTGPNVTGFCINQSNGKPIHVYDNVSRSEIDEAISIALFNSSVQQTVNGTHYEIQAIYKQNNLLGYDTVYRNFFYEEPVLVSNETGWSKFYTKFGYLDVYVNLEQNRVIKIQQIP